MESLPLNLSYSYVWFFKLSTHPTTSSDCNNTACTASILLFHRVSDKGFIVTFSFREENGPIIQEISISDCSTSFHSVLCQSQSIVCTTDALHPKFWAIIIALSRIVVLDSADSYFIYTDSTSSLFAIYDLYTKSSHLTHCRLSIHDENQRVFAGTSPMVNIRGNEMKKRTWKQKFSLQLSTASVFLPLFLQLGFLIGGDLFLNLDKVFTNVGICSGLLQIVVQEMKAIYADYVNAICNAMAISGLNLETKEAESLIEKSKDYFEALIPEDKKTNTEILSYLLLLPMNRIEEYENFLMDIRTDTECFYSPFSLDKIKVAHTHWKKLSIVAYNGKLYCSKSSGFNCFCTTCSCLEILNDFDIMGINSNCFLFYLIFVEAEHTKAFWNSCSPKVFEALANPTRRLIRDSKKTPINLFNAGRFSTHSFFLLSDLLIHNMYNSFVSYNLSSMWVETLPSGNNIQLIFHLEPEFLNSMKNTSQNLQVHCLLISVSKDAQSPSLVCIF
ncbi:Alsin [Armadillidium nasatum]|uniref:Alsin n=1 Tax=Armadillidium nasatum TaxID=96803 RepID=A0A5N5TMR8_9CRUS|nr:Alsin [Armadillidium nasatum]